MKKIMLLVAAAVFMVIPAGSVLAKPVTEPPVPEYFSLDLNNDTADMCAYADCGELGGWHFVISPNNNESYFITFHLNLGDATAKNTGTYDTSVFVPVSSDNVWVAVPTGKTYLSLETEFSTADIYWNGEKNRPFSFQLSNVCVPQVPEAGTLFLLGSGLLGVGLMRRRRD